MGNRRVVVSLVDPDEPAFAHLYACHREAVRDYCRRRVESDLVDDAVAETFLVAWRRLDDVPAGEEGLVWLYGVAYRVIGHQWRTLARRRRLDERLRAVVPRPASPVDGSVIDAEDHQLVLAAAARLGHRDAEVLRLTAWEQLTVAEVAAVLEISTNAVKQRLHRARQNLAREYRRLAGGQRSSPHDPTGGAQ